VTYVLIYDFKCSACAMEWREEEKAPPRLRASLDDHRKLVRVANCPRCGQQLLTYPNVHLSKEPAPRRRKKRVLCISWDPSLAKTREMLLHAAGYEVTSALGYEGTAPVGSQDVDLLVLGHSVPREQKIGLVRLFRQHSQAPILSLLAHHQEPLPEANYWVQGGDPAALIAQVREILG
jgi:CheY-like chemotaxis protein